MLMTVTALGLGVLAHQPFSEDCNDVNGELSQFFLAWHPNWHAALLHLASLPARGPARAQNARNWCQCQLTITQN